MPNNDEPNTASDDAPQGGGEDCSSESMGRVESDDGEESLVPMKQPANGGGAADADDSFLDEDFLSFPDDGSGGGEERDERPSAGHKRGRSDGGGVAGAASAAPWMMPRCAPAPVRGDQQRGRGYGGGGGRPPPTPPLVRLHNEIVGFARLMEPTAAELAERDAMVRRVTELALRTFGEGKCEVLTFGSQATGLCLPGSDIDFVIRFKKGGGGGGSGEQDEEDDYDPAPSNPLHAFADAVRDEFGVPGEFDAEDVLEISGGSATADDERLSYLEVIEHTRVPLVKFTVSPQNIDVDVCFDQPNGPESADLMHRFMESMPPLRPLTFALKYFLSSRDINKPFTGGIGSYLLQLMIVSFLQHRSREDASRGCGASGRHLNLGSLLVDFLELYGSDFNYVTAGISVRHDGYYFPKGAPDRREVFCGPRGPFGLAVENPLDVGMDVGAGAFRMQMIARIFGHAYKTLVACVSEPALLGPEESVLAMILPVSPEMERRRAMKADEEGGGVWTGAGGADGTAGARETGGRQRGGKHRKRNSQRREERGDDGGGGSSRKKRRKEHGGGSRGGGDGRDSKKSRKQKRKEDRHRH